MSDFDIVVEFPDFAIEALKRGEWITIDINGLCCKVIPYTLEEEIADELGDQEVVFKFEGRRKPKSNSP